MFTRVVELVSKQGNARELSSTINDKIVPILKKQPGFADEIVLVADADSNRVLALRFVTQSRLRFQGNWQVCLDGRGFLRRSGLSFVALYALC